MEIFKQKDPIDILGIDKGIKELVILLNQHGFFTTQSCWGHKHYGLNYPYVDIVINYNLSNLINEFKISKFYYGENLVRIYPTNKTLNGRIEFKKLKNKLKQL